MKKVLFIAANPWAAWGGSEKLWAYTAKYLQDHRLAKTSVLIRKWNSIEPVLVELLQSSTVFLQQSQHSIIDRSLGKLFHRFRPDLRNQRLFHQAIKGFDPDLVIVSQGANYDGLEWMEYCSCHEVPFISISQAASESFWLDSEAAGRLALALSQARHNFFVSKANLRSTELMVGKRLPNSSVLANPFDVPYDNQLEFPPVEPEFRLACVARYELHAKGQDVLLETLSDPKWKGRNLFVGLYGSGKDQCHIDKLIKCFELGKSVRIMGISKPVEIWKTNHALILPSRYEGLPLALVEAMMCGRFGIVTNVGGNAEIVEDNINGFIAEAPKAIYLDAALETAWARKGEWEVLGQKARAFISEKVPPDPVAVFAKALMNLS